MTSTSWKFLGGRKGGPWVTSVVVRHVGHATVWCTVPLASVSLWTRSRMHLRQNVWPHESRRGSFSPSSVKGSKQIMHSPAIKSAAGSMVVCV